MNRLTDEQVKQYHENGYLVVENFFTVEQCDSLKDRIHHIIAATKPEEIGGVFATGLEQKEKVRTDYFLTSSDKIRLFLEDKAVKNGQVIGPVAKAVNKIGHALHSLDPVFSAFTHSEALKTVCAQIGLKDARIPQSMYIFKQAHTGGEVTPHQDSTFLYTTPLSCTAIWIPLDDATLENGCLWAIPKSHSDPVHFRFKLDASKAKTYMEPPLPNDTLEHLWPSASYVPLEVKRGALVLLHGSVAHKSAPNLSDKARHVYTLHVIDGTTKWSEDNWLQYPDGQPFQSM